MQVLKNQDTMMLYSARPLTAIVPPKPCFLMKYPNPTSADILQRGIYEQSLIDWSKSFCSASKKFIDIGAHMGTYSILLAPYCAEVHSFEAQRMTYYQLCGAIALNHQANIFAHQVALGAKEQSGSRMTLNIVSDDGGGSTLRADIVPQVAPRVLAQESVEVKCLDDFGLEQVGFLKLDVEGYELNVIKGSIATLSDSDYPPFIFEVWPNEWYSSSRKELFDFVEELEYKISPIANYNNMFLATRK